MRSFLAALRSLVLPYGRTTGQRIVIDGVNAEISAYDVDGNEVIQFDTAGLHLYDPNHVEQITIGPDDVGDPAIFVQAGPADSNIALALNFGYPVFSMTAYDMPDGLGLSSQTTMEQFGAGAGVFGRWEHIVFGDTNVITRIRSGSADGTQKPEMAIDAPIKFMTSGGSTETWRTFAFSGAWVDSAGAVPARYRRMPDGTAMAKGRIQGGAIAVGSALFTLPPDWRPAQNCRFTVAQGSAAAGTDPAIDISAATGVATLARAPSAAFIYLDGMRWPTAALD